MHSAACAFVFVRACGSAFTSAVRSSTCPKAFVFTVIYEKQALYVCVCESNRSVLGIDFVESDCVKKVLSRTDVTIHLAL